MKQKNPRKARTVTRGSAADAAPGTGGTLSRAGAPAYTTFLIVLMHILGSYRERERESEGFLAVVFLCVSSRASTVIYNKPKSFGLYQDSFIHRFCCGWSQSIPPGSLRERWLNY